MNDIETMSANSDVQRLDFNTPALKRKRRIRALKDHLARWYVSIGGLAVLGAITLIFFYLAQVVLPMFQGAELESRAVQQPAWLAEAGEPLLLTIEEQNQVAMRLGNDGQVRFFGLRDGALLSSKSLPLPEGSRIVSVGQDTPGTRRLVLGLDNGQALVVEHNYKLTYPNNQKTITPELAYPFGEEPLQLDPEGRAIDRAAISMNGKTLLVAGATGTTLHAQRIASSENLLTGEVTLEQERLDKQLNGRYKLVGDGSEITSVSPLLGGISLMVGDSRGGIGQWFMVRAADGQAELKLVRNFKLGSSAIRQILPEERRKGFLALDDSGSLGVFHSTAHRTLLKEQVADGTALAAMSPRATRLLVESQQGLQRFVIDNPHPEISWSALWGKVWYESYPEPDYVWQSTSANSDFEPKLSLAPLAFGTLKAAFYAMLLAAPLAICAAFYTAYFMAPRLRSKVKPVIELMEALPTVILGFFAGLFLAPFLENHLPGIFALLLLMPVGILFAAWSWSRLPQSVRLAVPDGWEAVLLIPVILLIGYGSLEISGHLENWFFGGDMRLWLSNDMGIPFDQRNALVIGLAMGFAVIPTIYSIAEDAVFSVPRSLTLGSLALGATPWQTLTRVVLLTASPGIFSALMIGMGRAVGETMIVLMATGNTPIMEANIFEGMRTLAANV
ncbi:MAG: phosphate ABC transporter permease, partial [Gammaproteobacteria bacterium HGW-Gammaproteobacteria-9]